jgi:hypothetical protein
MVAMGRLLLVLLPLLLGGLAVAGVALKLAGRPRQSSAPQEPAWPAFELLMQ